MKGKHSVRAESGHVAGAAGAQEVAKTATSFIFISTFVDDGMGRRRVGDRLPERAWAGVQGIRHGERREEQSGLGRLEHRLVPQLRTPGGLGAASTAVVNTWGVGV